MRGLDRVAAAALALVLFAAACGDDDGDDANGADNGDDGTTTTAAELDEDAATAEIEAALTAFLASGGGVEGLDHVAGGDDEDFVEIYGEITEATAGVALEVRPGDLAVDFTSATTADITYDLVSVETGEVLIPGQAGSAVVHEGSWLLTATMTCDLAGLGAPDLIQPCLEAAPS